MAKTNIKTVNEYIRTFPKNVQEILEKIRQIIKEAAPGAEELISYQIPAFKLKGKYLIYFAGWKNHIGVYPISSGMESSIKELSEYYTSGKGTAQFPLNKPMPFPLIKKIVKHRIKENLEREKIK
jgi:uncharacterized protein YdhG (YjbR/CyaY superfamily)